MKELIRLFKAVEVGNSKKRKVSNKNLLEKSIKYGFIFAPEVVAEYSNNYLNNITRIVINEFGLTSEQMNNAFHKSWGKVRNATDTQLALEQLVHYITTYGFEQLGIYRDSTVYIPNENLNIPELDNGIRLTVIKGYTKEEIKDKVLKMLQSGIALTDQTVQDTFNIIKEYNLTSDELGSIKNKEVKIRLYDYLNKVPENPIEFLRYVIYKLTDKTLIIKDKKTIEAIKSIENDVGLVNLFNTYNSDYNISKLATIFYRFKPLFLSMRVNKQMKVYINLIRRLAKQYHKPMPEDYLNSVTGKIKNGKTINLVKLKKELDKVNTFRKIRLLYALKYRTIVSESILYKIRNGKSFATDFNFKAQEEARRILTVVLKSITDDISKNVKDKKVYIPDNMNYVLPSTEKQFIGSIPYGSYVLVKKDLVFGIHWENLDNGRIDLDLSMISATTKYGWDSLYRNKTRSILFSGDVTDAPKPKGASELYYVQKGHEDILLLMVNYYNDYDNYGEVPFKVFVAEEKVGKLENNYVVNPNNVICVVKTKMKEKQKILGLIVTKQDEQRFYYIESYLGNTITSTRNKYIEHSKNYLKAYYENTIDFKSILRKAGCKFTKDKSKCDIDLSPEVLEKDTILKLIMN